MTATSTIAATSDTLPSEDGLRYEDQGLSPLCEAAAPRNIAPQDIYGSMREVHRFALVDPNAPLFVGRLFTETTRTIRSVKGRPLKKPRLHVLPGAALGTVAFVDFHPFGQDGWYIDYMIVRPDMQDKGIGRQLARAFYQTAVQKGVHLVHWGHVWNEHAWSILQKMKTEFPTIHSLGKVYF